MELIGRAAIGRSLRNGVGERSLCFTLDGSAIDIPLIAGRCVARSNRSIYRQRHAVVCNRSILVAGDFNGGNRRFVSQIHGHRNVLAAAVLIYVGIRVTFAVCHSIAKHLCGFLVGTDLCVVPIDRNLRKVLALVIHSYCGNGVIKRVLIHLFDNLRLCADAHSCLQITCGDSFDDNFRALLIDPHADFVGLSAEFNLERKRTGFPSNQLHRIAGCNRVVVLVNLAGGRIVLHVSRAAGNRPLGVFRIVLAGIRHDRCLEVKRSAYLYFAVVHQRLILGRNSFHFKIRDLLEHKKLDCSSLTVQLSCNGSCAGAVNGKCRLPGLRVPVGNRYISRAVHRPVDVGSLTKRGIRTRRQRQRIANGKLQRRNFNTRVRALGNNVFSVFERQNARLTRDNAHRLRLLTV